MAFTFFMRDQPILDHAVDHLLALAAGRSKIRIWDAGCALGQEPYTLAILIAEKMGYFGFKTIYIDATDYDEENHFGDTVQAAEYPQEELQRIPENLFAKYFEPSSRAGYFRVVESLRSRVTFRYHNLLSFAQPGNDYSLVVCKNVLLHFSPEQRLEVLRMFHGALVSGGYLATEQTQKMPLELAASFTQVVADAQLHRKSG
ncbi:MAG TPA: CheR family methyltransferase [Geobacterales bacterium]|nr:CheR family methyltransferase [Geobacterales bacterium]